MDFHAECLRSHNEYRKKHGVAPLTLDKEMCKVSHQWATVLIRKGTLTHSNNRDYGENIFMIQSSNANFTISGREPVESWYEEIKFHKFGCEPKSLTSGHFTQVIWKGSKKLGVAFAKNGGKIIVVANYYPPGNMIGSFAENVPPLVGTDNVNNNTIDLAGQITDLSLIARSPNKSSRATTEINFEDHFLQAHNMYRKRHGIKPLELDKSLCKYAEEWARHLASRNILEHRPESNYGENIYCLHSSDPSMTINGNTPVDTWYKEIKNHHFGTEPKSLKSGHFTQVIWKASEKLGVGVAKSMQGTIFVVANYFPAGNFVGHYVDNCPPLKPQFYNDQTFHSLSRSNELEVQEHRSRNEGIDNEEFSKETLKVHNEYRRKHGVPDLILNIKICEFAQEWAEVCARTASLQHRANNTYGENIFSMYSSDYSNVPTARDVVKEWYDENKKYCFGDEKVAQGCLHFTQVIWKDSTDLGVGIAKNKKGQTYVVCNYSPRGNYIGQFSMNVPKPK